MTSRHGAHAVEIQPLEDVTEWRVGVVPLPVDATDFRLRHKISDRAFYDDARRSRPDCDEVVFVGTDGFLTEGSITALFVERDGKLLTPRLKTGLLPSIMRRELIEAGKAEEADLKIEDLSGGFWVGNSLRGLIRANRVA
jgi:para-aminobenzoate synthetase/4-amino-4-deoxychorismate lyase